MEHTVVTQVDLIFWCVWKRGISQSGQSGEWNMGKHIGNHESVRKHQSWASLSPDKPGRVFFSRSRYWGNTGRGFGGFGPDDFIAGLNDDSSSSKDFWLVNGYNPTRWCCIYSISCIHPQYFFLGPLRNGRWVERFLPRKIPQQQTANFIASCQCQPLILQVLHDPLYDVCLRSHPKKERRVLPEC